MANYFSDRVVVFSEMGEFLYQLGVGQLPSPHGIAIYSDSVYVSCSGDDTISKFSLTEMCRVRRIGGEGSNNGQFKFPHQLTTDPIGRVFIPDTGNNRICTRGTRKVLTFSYSSNSYHKYLYYIFSKYSP